MARPLYQAIAVRLDAAERTAAWRSKHTADAFSLFHKHRPRIDGFLTVTDPRLTQTAAGARLWFAGFVASTHDMTGGSYNVVVTPCLMHGVRLELTRGRNSNIEDSALDWLHDALYAVLTTLVEE